MNPPSFFRTVLVLLSAARKRSTGRIKHNRKLLKKRSGSGSDTFGALGLLFTVIFGALINGGCAYFVNLSLREGLRSDTEVSGKLVVRDKFIEAISNYEKSGDPSNQKWKDYADTYYSWEGQLRSDKIGGTKEENEKLLREQVEKYQTSGFAKESSLEGVVKKISKLGSFPKMLGSLAIGWWLIMMIFQGEGLIIDFQRRRHPMWEWLLSHPVKPGSVFLAEMFSPFAANPMYFTGIFFVGFLYSFIYGPQLGILAGIFIGLPISIASACIGKAIEIGVMLRFPPRSRGAMIGFMSWLGYAAMMAIIFGTMLASQLTRIVAPFLRPLAEVISWPWLGWFVGAKSDGSFSFISGMVFCWLISTVMIVLGVWFSVWGTERGLTGSTASEKIKPSSGKFLSMFGKNPLYLKEILWFSRDRSAIVQTFLLPLTLAAFQFFNMRHIVQAAGQSWHAISGLAVMFGTYLLWILGPMSLASEGTALWIPQTWPRGLEEIMKAKARLWFVIATAVVLAVLTYVAFRFPESAWKVTVIFIGWIAFGYSMAQKSVTLASVTSSAGDSQPVPRGRKWAASLGMLTFGIGIVTQRWSIAIVGIVYSAFTAAAMWENFRARLPFLFDPWSEKLPTPPTLMHSMISISALVEGSAIVTGLFTAFMSDNDTRSLAIPLGYGIMAVLVSVTVSQVLRHGGVPHNKIWFWKNDSNQMEKLWGNKESKPVEYFLRSVLFGMITGVLLGIFAFGYVSILSKFEFFAKIFEKSHEILQNSPNLLLSYAVLAILFAPFAEEYLFRGLLYRTLDREWKGWHALLGSGLFFAIYHPPISWVPVAVLGVTNAILFKKTGTLTSAIVSHMIYNVIAVFIIQ